MLSDTEAIGLRFGLLTVVSRFGKDKRNHTLWLCECECGGTTTTEMDSIKSGKKLSCGCLKRAAQKYGSIKHGAKCQSAPKELRRTFDVWVGMRKRCNNPNDRAYKWYGGKGITICPEWNTFSGFISDIGIIPDSLTLERVDVHGPYSRENCTLIPLSAQAANKTTTLWIEYQGTKWCLKNLCTHLNIPYARTWKRLY